ncbi:MAG: 50S ribosomal protein L14e [Promethearchaeota archaeon]
MPAIEIGRICVKTAGREVGRKCVIIDIIDPNTVQITGPKELNGVKRRRVSIRHIEPTTESIKIKRNADDEAILQAVEAAGKTDIMKERVKIVLP